MMGTPTAALGDPGPLIVTADVNKAVIAALTSFLPTFLRITSDERNLPKVLPMPKPANIGTVMTEEQFLDRRLPGVLVTTSKTSGTPVRMADGSYGATWEVVVSAVVRGTVGDETHDRASYYEGAIRRCLGHRNVITQVPIITGSKWLGAETAPVADVSRSGRYLAAGISTFQIITDQAFKDSAGPQTPDIPTYVPVAPITEVDITEALYDPSQELPGGTE